MGPYRKKKVVLLTPPEILYTQEMKPRKSNQMRQIPGKQPGAALPVVP
jgi:hypothetical protein